MDSWKYSSISEGKNVWLSEGVDYQVEDHNCKSKFMGSESENKPILNVENYPLISNTQALDRLDFMDLGFADDIRKSYSISSEPSGEVFSDEIGTSDYHPQLGEERESNDFMQSNNQDFSLVDLKLGSLGDGGIVRGSELSKVDVPESSMMLSPVKRARPSNPSCQVLGCNKDLGSFKSYYKRHKVCDVHTKTPKVIVDGIEQRFCQQCSRFHLLNEFDDIKRSCRRRLAAHNKRRRRPQLTSEPGSGIIDFSSSLAFPEGMPNVFLGSNKYEGTEDSSKTSNFHLQMGCVEEKMDKIPENIKGNNIFGVMKPAIDNTPCIQHTSRALSLLSAQSQSISSHHLLESSTSTPLVNKSINADSINHHSAGIITRIAQSGPLTSGLYSMEADEEGPSTLNPSNGNTVGIPLQDDGILSRPSLRGSDCFNPKGNGIILNLLQLSSNLERVEHQRHSTENEAG